MPGKIFSEPSTNRIAPSNWVGNGPQRQAQGKLRQRRPTRWMELFSVSTQLRQLRQCHICQHLLLSSQQFVQSTDACLAFASSLSTQTSTRATPRITVRAEGRNPPVPQHDPRPPTPSMNLALDCGVAEELGSQPLSGPGAKHLNDDAIARDAECDARDGAWGLGATKTLIPLTWNAERKHVSPNACSFHFRPALILTRTPGAVISGTMAEGCGCIAQPGIPVTQAHRTTTTFLTGHGARAWPGTLPGKDPGLSRRTMIWTGKVRSLPEHNHRRSSEDAMTLGKDKARPPEQCRGDPGLLRLLQSATRHVQCLYVAVMANTSGPGEKV
ncbi:hypothetical protein MRS44_003405 [Fusarium solani]|uniref:uncharacterized protein n=1 Tax=Fusarium solani TaxID=169388 RepID=UPI0032C3E044|nr:hypothetical protein MRS44_003405 [Fusarium solani]